MATCAPTAWARAPTVLNWLQSSLAHTTKERSVPTTGGLARGVDAATAGARRAVAAGNRSARPRARSMPSNSVAAARGAAGSTRRCASGMAAAISIAARRLKSAVWPNVPAADCATSRYSAESTDVLAGNVTHPPSASGSIDTYAPTASVSCDASAELHVGALGPVASWPHAAVATSAQVTIRAAVRCFIPTSALVSPSVLCVHQFPDHERAHQHHPVHTDDQRAGRKIPGEREPEAEDRRQRARAPRDAGEAFHVTREQEGDHTRHLVGDQHRRG